MIRNVTYDGVVPANQVARSEVIAVGDGADDTISATLTNPAVMPGSLSVTAATVVGTDNGAGSITGVGIDSGTINYVTGAIAIDFTTAPASGVDIVAAYKGGTISKEYAELVPTVGGVMITQKIVPTNVINQAGGLPTESNDVEYYITGSPDGGVNFQELGKGTVKGGGAVAVDWGAAQFNPVRVYIDQPSNLPAVAHLTTLWNNPTI